MVHVTLTVQNVYDVEIFLLAALWHICKHDHLLKPESHKMKQAMGSLLEYHCQKLVKQLLLKYHCQNLKYSKTIGAFTEPDANAIHTTSN